MRIKMHVRVLVVTYTAAGCPRYVAIHIHTSRSHDAIEPNDETCDILVPNELKNAEHLGLTV